MSLHYPLPRAEGTLYDLLGIGPEASAEEILDAKQSRRNQIVARVAAADREMKQLAERTGSDPHAGSITDQQRELESRKASLNEELDRFNLEMSKLENPENRKAYDASHPPCALLKLDSLDFPLSNRRLLPLLLRREVSQFLEALGEPVFHPSDLTRSDFTGDFTPSPLLQTPGRR